MPTTLPRRADARDSAHTTVGARRVAAAIGMTPASADKYLQLAPLRVAAAIRAALAAGDTVAAEKYFAPIESAFAVAATSDCLQAFRQLLARTAEADAADDVARTLWLIETTPRSDRQLLAAVDRSMAMLRQVRTALAARVAP